MPTRPRLRRALSYLMRIVATFPIAAKAQTTIMSRHAPCACVYV